MISTRQKRTAWFLLWVMSINLIPKEVWALTGGPSQPEVETFQPIEVTDMVDPATGDFSYNIPLMEVGGYPINLIYNAGITMDQEASIVGLGWNINPGVITRSVRGIPDDFKGDTIVKTVDIKDDYTIGVSGATGDIELFGVKLTGNKLFDSIDGSFGASAGLNYNNYNGLGFEYNVTQSFGFQKLGSYGADLKLGLSFSSTSAVTFSPSASLSLKANAEKKRDRNHYLQVGTSINSIAGLKDMSFSSVSSKEVIKKSKKEDGTETIDRIYNTRGTLGSSSYSFANSTFSPSVNHDMLTTGATFSFGLGLEASGSFPKAISLSGYFNKTGMMHKMNQIKSFGYLYEDESGEGNVLHDFNRYMDGVFMENTPNLPLTVLCNDIYSLSGQGIGGSYQLKRGDIGLISDTRANTYSGNFSLGFEAGAGVVFRLGGDIHSIYSKAYSGKWKLDNEEPSSILDRIKYFSGEINKADYEKAIFIAAGEPTPFINSQENIYKDMGSSNPVKVKLDASSSLVTLSDDLIDKNNSTYSINADQKRTSRIKRNQNISYLNASEASVFGMNKKLLSYPILSSPSTSISNPSVLNRTALGRNHHISEITTINAEGLRYVYGIPAYNHTQVEFSFAVDPNVVPSCNTGLVNYSIQSNGDPYHKHNNTNHYYSKEETPAYAYAYLLTSILSEDYVDLTADGPTPDDLGTYTKFNYSKLHDRYRWRTPFQNANFNEGLLASKADNKANFIYGEKDIWILQSIESKTQIAEFYYSDRHDGYGVLNQDGNKNLSLKLKKLDQISLYSIPDYNINVPSNRTPIKSIHLRYNYELCPSVPNNDGIQDLDGSNASKGKLTLKSLYFLYGNSNKGRFSPYKFEYNSFNPYFSNKSYNRWGTYQPCNIANNNDVLTNCSDPYSKSTQNIPYVPQELNSSPSFAKTDADKNASAWCLTDITLPSGEKINVSYEVDDYAYVQDRQAMQMTEIIGCSSSISDLTSIGSNEINLYDDSSLPNIPNPHQYIFFNLSNSFPGSLSDQQAKDSIKLLYIRDIIESDLLFKVFARLDFTSAYDFVQGYCNLDDFGAIKNNSVNYNIGYVKLKTTCTKDREWNSEDGCQGLFNHIANPISKAIWQCSRLNYPKLINGNLGSTSIAGIEHTDNEDDVYNAAEALVSAFSSFQDVIQGGTNNKLLTNGYGKVILKGKSFIRLYNPQMKKLAGTHRVKQITINDNWSLMTAGTSSDSYYGQEFDYSTTDELKIISGKISSGVAAYEPLLGGEENPFKLPISWKEELKLAPDNNHYLEEPIGEPYYPAPTIIYSNVKVSNLKYSNVNKKATGWTNYNYYTAKDFPVIELQTDLQAAPKKTNPILNLLKIYNKNFMTASQGYSIILNDMHGKVKSKDVYNQTGTRISGISYFYKEENVSEVNSKLSNSVNFLNPTGQIIKGTIGINYNFIADQRESNTKTHSGGVNLNVDNILFGLVVLPVPIPLPFYSYEETKFRSICITKLIHQSGILSHTIAYDLGSTVETRNLVWDEITGEVLLTQTFNEFEDPIYNFTYPAHWVYKGMQSAYQNIHAMYEANISSGIASVISPHVFCEGDEVSVNGLTNAWVKKINSTNIELVDFNGNPTPSQINVKLKVIRSGHRNKASASIGSIVSLVNPLITGGLSSNGNNRVINASAIEMNDQRNIYCCDSIPGYCNCNPITYNGIANSSMILEFFNNCDISVIPFSYSSVPTSLVSSIVNLFKQDKCNIKPTEYANIKYKKENITLPSGKKLIKITFQSNGSTNCTCSLTIEVSNFNTYKIIISDFNSHISCKGDNSSLVVTEYIHQAFGPDIIVSGTRDFTSDCIQLFKDCRYLEGSPATDLNKINPYTTNFKGTYTPKKSYTFLADRKSSSSGTTEPKLRTDGYFVNNAGVDFFDPFWKKVGPSWIPNPLNWTWTAEVTKIHPNGNELESRDPLDRFSCEMLGYNNQMVIAVAGNARYGDAFFEGFEDYSYTLGSRNNNSCSDKKYFEFKNIKNKITKSIASAHSGKYFLSLEPGSSASAEYSLRECSDKKVDSITIEIPNRNKKSKTKKIFTRILQPDTSINPCLCLNSFNPEEGNYIFSAWINESRDPLIHNFDQSKCVVYVNGSATEIKASGPIIEGWQRVYGEFKIPAGSTKIKISLVASPDNWTYFDDIRVHPFDASFKSFVYDDISLKFTYELDENNFFTKYEYDDSGKLERVKKETERGIMTIQETRMSNIKKPQ